MRIFFIFISFALLLGCKKEEDPSIIGKWELDKIHYEEIQNGTFFSQDYEISNETIEFRTDGMVERDDSLAGKRVSVYTISDNKITFESVTYEIRDLTKSSVTLYDHHTHGPGEYHDTYLYLVR